MQAHVPKQPLFQIANLSLVILNYHKKSETVN